MKSFNKETTKGIWLLILSTIIISGQLNAETTYTLTMEESTGGYTTPAFGVSTRAENEIVNISASPSPGYRFLNWVGNVTDLKASSTTVITNSDKIVKANFKKTYVLTMQASPGGTTTPTFRDSTYDENEVVNISTTPEAGYMFVKWEGSVTDQNASSTTVTMSSDKTVKANFAVIRTLTMAVSPTGSGTTTPLLGTHDYYNGQTVPISASPSPGYRFLNWVGDVTDLKASSTTVIMNSDKIVKANFNLQREIIQNAPQKPVLQGTPDKKVGIPLTFICAKADLVSSVNHQLEHCFLWGDGESSAWKTGSSLNETHTYQRHGNYNVCIESRCKEHTEINKQSDSLQLDVTGHHLTTIVKPNANFGKITANPDTTTIGYNHREPVRLIAIASSDAFIFIDWRIDGRLYAKSADTTLVMDGEKIIEALFDSARVLIIETTAGGTTDPEPTGSHRYPVNQVVTIMAIADHGFKFLKWEGDIDPAQAPKDTIGVVMNKDKTLKAVFIESQASPLAVTNYPNPFGGEKLDTQIVCKIIDDCYINLTIFDLAGSVVYWEKKKASPPQAIFTWNATNLGRHPLANGIYICEVRVKYRDKEVVQHRKIAVFRGSIKH